MSTVDIALIRAYLANARKALQSVDVSHAEILVGWAQKLLAQQFAPLSVDLSMQMSVGIGLNTGIKRQGKPNEDFAFAATDVNVQTQETYGLFIVADGMGGHANGQVASRLATETIVNTLLPFLHCECVQASNLGDRLVEAATRANTVIYEQNQQGVTSQPLDQMGTTITMAVVLGPHAFIANIGDSRTYLYRPGVGLRTITRDHSVVANLVAEGAIQPDEMYTHPKRNVIWRCLGAAPMVEVDLFYEELQDGDILLLCTDGVWEMTRNPPIEQILSSSWLSAEHMAERLMYAALQGGGLDNIGLIVSQVQMDLTAMQTIVRSPSIYAAAAS
ncbi:MAG TPA: protein phosphatase 2C domain-containing protein [Ktedonobacteraceae bacterium]|nr:protein phosphatase 2C domain-containing protein [Ktedonobacteraceae bacterium]